jgi:hypothetical protein
VDVVDDDEELDAAVSAVNETSTPFIGLLGAVESTT